MARIKTFSKRNHDRKKEAEATLPQSVDFQSLRDRAPRPDTLADQSLFLEEMELYTLYLQEHAPQKFTRHNFSQSFYLLLHRFPHSRLLATIAALKDYYDIEPRETANFAASLPIPLQKRLLREEGSVARSFFGNETKKWAAAIVAASKI